MGDDLRVVRAAIRIEYGAVFSLPIPARHHDLIRELTEQGYSGPIHGDQQGFLLNDGRGVYHCHLNDPVMCHHGRNVYHRRDYEPDKRSKYRFPTRTNNGSLESRKIPSIRLYGRLCQSASAGL